jgi:hypothetical protein
LLKALITLVPVGLLFMGSVVLFYRERKASSFLQLIGASCFLMVVLTHICEALRLFTFMSWGREQSVGHYLDLTSAAIGITLFPLGYLLQALSKDVSTMAQPPLDTPNRP